MSKKYIVGGLVVVALIAGGIFLKTRTQTSVPVQNFVSYKDPGLTADEKAVFQKKITELETALKDAKDTNTKFKLTMQIGIQHYALGELALAKEQYMIAAKILPDNPTVWSELYVVENAMTDYQSARAHIQKAIDLNPASPQYWRWKIDLEKDHFSPTPKMIEDLYTEALAKTNNSAEILSLEARYFETIQRYTDAMDIWKHLKEVNPSESTVYDQEIKTLQAKIK